MRIRLYVTLMLLGFGLITTQVFTLMPNAILLGVGFCIMLVAIGLIIDHIDRYPFESEEYRWWKDR